MAGPDPSQQPQQPSAAPASGGVRGPSVPLAIGAGLVAVAILVQTGYLTLPTSGVYEIQPPATLGKYCSYEFSELISFLPPESTGAPYTYYLGPNVGFPPMGLILGIDGVLRGTPTGSGSTFEVCVQDVGMRSTCRKYHLAVNPAETPPVTRITPPGTCPVTSCDTGTCCGSVQGGIGVTGVRVHESCGCPGDTVFAGWDRTTPGGPYRMCTCKKG